MSSELYDPFIITFGWLNASNHLSNPFSGSTMVLVISKLVFTKTGSAFSFIPATLRLKGKSTAIPPINSAFNPNSCTFVPSSNPNRCFSESCPLSSVDPCDASSVSVNRALLSNRILSPLLKASGIGITIIPSSCLPIA